MNVESASREAERNAKGQLRFSMGGFLFWVVFFPPLVLVAFLVLSALNFPTHDRTVYLVGALVGMFGAFGFGMFKAGVWWP